MKAIDVCVATGQGGNDLLGNRKQQGEQKLVLGNLALVRPSNLNPTRPTKLHLALLLGRLVPFSLPFGFPFVSYISLPLRLGLSDYNHCKTSFPNTYTSAK